jgi:hypothetical protein
MLAIAAVGLGGCRLFASADPEPSADDRFGSALSGPTAPGGSEIAVPDPLHPTTHEAGETVGIPGGSIVYLGLAREDGGFVAEFRMASGAAPPDAEVLVSDGTVLPLTADNGLLRSAPFGDPSQPPAPGDVLTLVVGEILVAFEVGPAT